MAIAELCKKKLQMKNFIFFTFLTLFIIHHSNAQTVKGKVLDLQNSPLPGASVYVMETFKGTITDMDGSFEISLSPGQYHLIASFVGYKNDTVKITLAKNETKTMQIKLKEASLDLDAFEIYETRKTQTTTAVLMEIKNAPQVATGISSEQIKQSQDRNLSEAVKRSAGVSIFNNRFIVVRGLNDRYNTTWLNETAAPSFESDRRSFAYDVLPSSMIDRIIIYKSATPDLPGDFAGGAIKIFTKNQVDSNFTSIQYSSSYRQSTTFDAFNINRAGAMDMVGFGQQYRQLPVGFVSDMRKIQEKTDIVNQSRLLPNTWNWKTTQAMPDQRLNIVRGWNKKITGGIITNLLSIGYSNTNLSYKAQNLNYNAFDINTGRADTIYNYEDAVYQNTIRTNIINALSIVHGKNKFSLTFFFNNNADNIFTERQGYNLEEGFRVKNYAMQYRQRTLISQTFNAERELPRGKIYFNANYSRAIENQPDFKRIRTVKDITDTDFNTSYQVIIPPSASVLDAGRYFGRTDENTFTAWSQYSHNLGNDENTKNQWITGIYYENRQRAFNARWISYTKASNSKFDNNLIFLPIDEIFSEKNINDSTGFLLEEGTNPSDRYVANSQNLAGFTMFKMQITPRWFVTTGVRVENFSQYLNSKNYSGSPVVVNKVKTNILPSINSAYDLTEKSKFRTSYFMSVNRPEFRELAPFAFYDFNFNNVLFGNDSLKMATIHNADLRYEFYPSMGEIITLGVFYKYFQNPIEMYFVPGSGSGGTRNFTFDNAPKANSYGIEAELRKNIKTKSKILRDKFTFVLNAAYIFSRVDLGSRAQGQETVRPLMGQSPYTFNAGIYFHDTASGWQVNAIYNIIGPRIFVVGSYGTPDIYEMPRGMFDINISKTFFKNHQWFISCQNILNSPFKLMQDANEDGVIRKSDQLIMQYKIGVYITAGVQLKF